MRFVRPISVVVVAILVLTITGVAAFPGQASPPQDDVTVSAVTVTSRISYQGRLTSSSGSPLSGTHPMRFQVYDAASSGTLLWDSGIVNLAVDNGLFNVALDVPQSMVNGQALWLSIYVDGEWLSPRQELMPVPYALSVRPGAEVRGSPPAWEGSVLKVTVDGTYPLGKGVWSTMATGSAVKGESTGGYGLYGYSESGNGVYAKSENKAAGVFSSTNSVGIHVTTSGPKTYDYAGFFSAVMGYGILVKSLNNMAIRGEAGNIAGMWQPSGKVGVVGLGESRGVWGSSDTGYGVEGHSNSESGVYGRTSSTSFTTGSVEGYHDTDGVAVYGVKTGNLGAAVLGHNEGTSGSGVIGESTNFVGVWADSTNDTGVRANTARTDHNYGIYTPDNLYSLNYHTTGAIMHVVVNGGSEAVETGDVVVFSGVTAPAKAGDPPVIQVAKSSTAGSTAVAGVVYGAYKPPANGSPMGTTDDTPQLTPSSTAAPGEYLLLVVQGPARVKASALNASIKAGDLLASSAKSGFSAQASPSEGVSTMSGCVLGKALESVDVSQEKLIYVYVTLQ